MTSDYYTFDIFKPFTIILSVFLKKDRQNNGQRFEDIKSVVIRSHKYKRKTDKIMAKGLKISKV
jgi:hypothetical protein